MTYTYSATEFKNIERKEYNLSLVKTDRNGTKYYEGVQKCWKCDGSGYISYFNYYAQGVCFACNGNGVNPCKVKVMTDEHAKKLEDKRAEKRQKEIDERKREQKNLNAKFLSDNGFNPEGKAYLFIKTGFVNKQFANELISKGAKKYGYNIFIFPEPRADYNCIEFSAEDCFFADIYGVYVDFDYHKMNKILSDFIEQEKAEKAKKSAYYGNIGDKLKDFELTFKHLFVIDTKFGSMGVFIFEDNAGNQFKWGTSSGFSRDIADGEVIKINATIKEYSEYNGIKQTVLTRCKLAE